jgi:hypothetical protein
VRLDAKPVVKIMISADTADDSINRNSADATVNGIVGFFITLIFTETFRILLYQLRLFIGVTSPLFSGEYRFQK